MDRRIEQMLESYSSSNKEYIIKEILQEIVLSGLSRSDFFKFACFYGGTALRIIHKINRFSEDLDFVLYKDIDNFDLSKYKKYIEDELLSYGLNFKLVIRNIDPDFKMARGNLKGNMREVVLTFYPKDKVNKYNPEQLMRIKLEISLHKDDNAFIETSYRLLPIPYQLITYDLPSLFACKIAALLSRNYKNREKGRDFFDYIYYMKLKVKPNLALLKEKLINNVFIKKDYEIDNKSIKQLLFTRFKTADFNLVKFDIQPFIEDKREIELYSSSFFIKLTDKYFK